MCLIRESLSVNHPYNATGANPMEPLEVEVKFYISNPHDLQHQILELGAETRGRIFETNIRYEDAENSLYIEHIL